MTILLDKLNSIGAVVLSAGKGTRLNCEDVPKVMLEIGSKPIVSYIVETLIDIGFKKEQIMLVVGYQGEIIKKYLGDGVSYAIQSEQLGTAHASLTGIKELPKNIKQVLVLGGDDSAFYTKETLEKFLENHLDEKATVSLLVGEISADIQKQQIGRVIKGKDGWEIIEKENLKDEQFDLKEISTGTFVFDREWFEKNYKNIEKIKNLGEYGLPSMFSLVKEQGLKINVVKLENINEWFGINTSEELEMANKRLK